MDTKITLNDMKVNIWEKGTVRAEVTDMDGNPVNGRAVVKINQITRIQGNVVNGVFCEEHDFSDLVNDEYEITMIYGGTSICNPSEAKAKLVLNKDKPVYVSISDLENACYRLTKWIEVNKKLPGRIAINKDNVAIGDLLYVVSKAVCNIADGVSEDVLVKKFDAPKVSSESITETFELTMDEYVAFAREIVEYMDVEYVSPSSVSHEFGRIGFMNLVYTLSKVISNSSSESLISSVYIRPWNDIVAK
ncbi:MAG: hypothetical protein BZ136_02185 [Methanosphaera sp. rholeuAM74]|nr:MAG: hypothetical protein BZ136_02185 [Methanosphaera sp. rholeuAM74]